MAAYQSGYTGAEIDTAIYNINNFVNLVYPVGSIYISVNPTNPGVLFGGTWEMINEKFLFAGSSANFPYGSTGGEATHTLTVDQIPNHGHLVYVWDNAGTTGNAYYYNGTTKTTHTGARVYNSSASTWVSSGSTASAAGSGRGDPSGSTGVSGGGGAAHNNMPPYLSVYMWKRIE